MGRPRVRSSSDKPRRDLPDNVLGLPLRRLYSVSAHPGRDLAAVGTHSPAAAAAAEQHAITMLDLLDLHDEQDAARMFLDVPEQQRRDRAAGVTAVLLSAAHDELLAARDHHNLPDARLRRLTELELATVRTGTLHWPQRLVAVALAEQGAVAGQIADVTANQPSRDAHGVHVPLQAARGVRARTVTLEPWATEPAWQAIQIARRDGHRPCLTSEPPNRDRARRNVHETLRRALAVAGVAATPTSIRATAAHQARDTDGLLAAWQLLGTTRPSAAQALLDST